MPRFNYAEISASCVHLYSISLIVSSLNKLNRKGPPALSLSRNDPRANEARIVLLNQRGIERVRYEPADRADADVPGDMALAFGF